MSGGADDPVGCFRSVPWRIYLDTGTLQTIFDYGGPIWENEPIELTGRERSVAGLADHIEALRKIMAVNERSQFEFVVTAASLREVDARQDPRYAQWVRDVLDVWLVQSDGHQPESLGAGRPGSVSAKDWLLLSDAVDYRCDAFLTMERRLATQAPVIERKLGIRLMNPTSLWDLLAPWASLYF